MLTASLRKQFIQTVRFIHSDIEFELITMDARIERRVFTVRQVERNVTSSSRLTGVYRCMRTQFRQSMITSYRRVSKRDSLTRQNSFPSAVPVTLQMKCRFRFLAALLNNRSTIHTQPSCDII